MGSQGVIRLGLTGSGEARGYAPEADLIPEVRGHEDAAVILAEHAGNCKS